MNAPAERDVAVVSPADVEAVGVGELRRVPVGRADEGHHHLALADGLASDGDVLAGNARGALHRPVVAQQLLHRAPDEPGVFPEAAGAGPDAGAARVPLPIRFTVVAWPASSSRMQVGHQLVGRELVTRLLGGDQAVTCRRAAARGARRRELAEIGGERAARIHAAHRHLGVRRQHDGVEAAGDVEPPALEAPVVRQRDAQHLADHDHGQGIGELLDQVHLVGARHLVEQPVHDLLDARA